MMRVVESLDELRACRAEWREAGERVAFVPTMGNLHAGHLELVRQARQDAVRTVVSIFVNPLQFGPREDFERYPRTLAEDVRQLQGAGVDLMFLPPLTTIYPSGMQAHTRVEVPGLSNILCGERRPGHFVGVATVVCKLLNMVQPDLAVFGEKDYQQLLVIRRMVVDLAMPVEILGVPIQREMDGLALSSRNAYLTAMERCRAPELYRTLRAAARDLQSAARDLRLVEQQAIERLRAAGLVPDYVSVRSAIDLSPPDPEQRALVVLGAAMLGRTRLIDNLRLDLE